MASLHRNFLAGLISDNPLGDSDTTINSSAFVYLPEVAGGDYMWLTLDPDAVDGAPEIVKVVAHTSSGTQVTVERAQQGTVARQHAQSTEWRHAITRFDIENANPIAKAGAAVGDLLVVNSSGRTSRLPVGTNNRPLVADSNATEGVTYKQLPGDGIANNAVNSNKIADGAVTEAKIAAGAVTTAKLQDEAVTSAKIATGAVTGTVIGSSAITEEKLAAGAVSEGKLAGALLEALSFKGCQVSVVSQAATGSTTTDLVFTGSAVDEGNFFAGNTKNIVVPVGAAGVYAISGRAVRSTGNWSGGYVYVTLNGSAYQFGPPGTNNAAYCLVAFLDEGAVVNVGVYPGASGTDVTAVCNVVRLPSLGLTL